MSTVNHGVDTTTHDYTLRIEYDPDCESPLYEDDQEWVNGNCYGYVIEDEQGEHVDSCWGFVGYEYAELEGQEALERCKANPDKVM